MNWRVVAWAFVMFMFLSGVFSFVHGLSGQGHSSFVPSVTELKSPITAEETPYLVMVNEGEGFVFWSIGDRDWSDWYIGTVRGHPNGVWVALESEMPIGKGGFSTPQGAANWLVALMCERYGGAIRRELEGDKPAHGAPDDDEEVRAKGENQ